jgi:tetratricopeptide (TPR) repeat protein
MKPAPATRIAILIAMAIYLFLSGCASHNPQRIFSREARLHGEHASFIPRVPAFEKTGPQNEWGSLAGILRFWGSAPSPHFLETKNPSLPSGVSPFFMQAVREAHEKDLWAFASSMPMDVLKSRLRAGAPILVPLQDKLLDFESRHYVIVAGFDDITQKVFVFDGTPRGAVLDYGFFLKKWSIQRFSALLICPPGFPSWDLSGPELLSRADFYYDRGSFTNALEDYRQAEKKDYDDAAALIGEGNTLRALREYTQAETAYRKAIAVAPRNETGYNNLSYLLSEQTNKLEEAVALARQATILSPRNAFAFDSLGFAYYQAGRYKEAEDAFEKARSRAQSHPLQIREEIAVHLVRNYLKSGQKHLASQVLSDILRDHPACQVPSDFQDLLPK